MLQINTFQYNPKDMARDQCAEYGGKDHGCTTQTCPWLAKRIEAQWGPHKAVLWLCGERRSKGANAVFAVPQVKTEWSGLCDDAAGYAEAVRETFPHDAHLDARLRTVVHRFTGSLFLSPGHERRMERIKTEQGYRRKRDTPAYYAAMYLLASNEDLCRRAEGCFCRQGIRFDDADLRDITPHDFTLFSAARDIYTDSSGTMVSDLANAEVVDTLAFSLIVNALLVARYGCPVLKITDREGRT